MTSDAPPRASSGAAALAVGSVVSGLLAYVFFALVTRGLGAAAAAPVSVLWAYWGFAAAGVTFPVQHWIARSVAADGHEAAARAALPRVLALALSASAGSALVAWLLRDPLFGDDGAGFPVLVGAVTACSAAMGVVRGVLAARGRFAAVGAVLVGENLLRCVAAQVLLSSGVTDPAAYGGALLAGYAACLAWPSAWRLRGAAAPARTAVAFLGGAAGGQVVGQAVLTGGPVLLALAGGAPRDVTALFAGLALFRAPYTLAVGQVSALTSRVTGLVVAGRVRELRRLHVALLTGTAVAAVGAGVVGALVGPLLLRLVFGADAALDPGVSALVAAGTTFAMASLVLSVLVMAHDRAPRIALVWLLALVPGALAFVLTTGELQRVVVAFVVVEVAAWAGLVLAARPEGRVRV
jgi:O-antigen/teichoic acid export membrane protein